MIKSLNFSILVVMIIKVDGITSNLPFFLKNSNLGFDLKNYSSLPCDDFYSFSCSSWISTNKKPTYEPIWNPWLEAGHDLNQKLVKILKSENDDKALSKSRHFYESCVRAPLFETKYLTDLRQIIKNLKGWPIISENCNLKDYDWLEESMKITRFLGIFPVIKTHVDIDYKNTKKFIIYIEPGDLIYPRHILTNPLKYPAEIEAYEKWIYETVRHIYFNKNNEKLKRRAQNIVKFEQRLAKLRKKSKNERLTIGELSKRIPLNWHKSFKLLFEGSDVIINENDPIIIRNYLYLKDLFLLFNKLEKEDIANYLIWSLVRDLSRETTSYMRNLNFYVDKAVLGVQSDLSRPAECISKTVEYFSYALIPQYTQKFIQNSVLRQVENMILSIRDEYATLIRNSEWISEDAKDLSLEKAESIRYFVGYPKWTRNQTLTEDYYKEIAITDNHFTNLLKIKSFRVRKQLNKLRHQVTEVQWPSTAFEVNAFYSILQNSIFIPLGLLQAPFFVPDRPKVFNFGALGTLIGHEISHSLDNLGRQADKNGIITKWWPHRDIAKYEQRSRCFDKHYSTSENIADNVGLEISLKAYERLNLEDVQLKLFFISFAQMWCEISARSDLFPDDPHNPVESRVNWTLHNNRNFSNEFKCNPNPSRCKIW